MLQAILAPRCQLSSSSCKPLCSDSMSWAPRAGVTLGSQRLSQPPHSSSLTVSSIFHCKLRNWHILIYLFVLCESGDSRSIPLRTVSWGSLTNTRLCTCKTTVPPRIPPFYRRPVRRDELGQPWRQFLLRLLAVPHRAGSAGPS